MVALTGITRFKVRINMLQIALCLHGDKPDATCRACSIGLSMAVLGADVKWYNDPENNAIRIIEGEISTEKGRQALARLIAYAYGHIDPLDLIAINKGMQPLWA